MTKGELRKLRKAGVLQDYKPAPVEKPKRMRKVKEKGWDAWARRTYDTH
jgi:hypothetical protein